MNKKEMQVLINDIFNEIQDVREEGQKEYARNSSNAFANFERIAKLIDVKREKVLMTYLFKHIDGIMSYINGHTSQREDVRGRIKDAICYLCLLWGMVETKPVATAKVDSPFEEPYYDTKV